MLENDRLNPRLAWALVCVLALAGGWSALAGALLWASFAAASVAIALIPAVALRDATAMVPWEILAVAVLPLASTAVGVPAPLVEAATYLAVAALALLVVVELYAFSSMRMTARFGIVLTVLLTMATASLWTIVRYFADRYLGTNYLTGLTQTELMWDLLLAIAVGTIGALCLGAYVRWRGLATVRTEVRSSDSA